MNKINFKKWAFHFLIWVIVINIIIFYKSTRYTSVLIEQDNTGLAIFYLGVIATILLLMSLIFVVLSTIKKEQKNYQYWISVIGIILFGIFPIILNIL